MRAQQGQARLARSAVTGLIAVWVGCAAWSLAKAPAVHASQATAATVPAAGTSDDEHDEAPGDNPQAGGPASRDLHEESPMGGESTDPTPEPARKRGIRPPWRENAIPELRNQPGRRPRKMTS